MSFSTSLPLLLVLLPHSSSTGLFVSWIEGVQQPARVLLWGRIFLRDSGGASARLGQRNANNRLARIMGVWFWAAVKKKKKMKRCWIIVKKAAAVSLNSRAACLFFQVPRFKVLRQHVGAVGVFTSPSCNEQDVPRSPLSTPSPPHSCSHVLTFFLRLLLSCAHSWVVV